MRRVLHIGPCDTPGGMAKVMHILAENPPEGWDAELLSSHKIGNPITKWLAYRNAKKKFKKILLSKENRIDVVHVHTASDWSWWRKKRFVALARKFSIPCIIHIHSGKFDSWMRSPNSKRAKKIRTFINDTNSIIVVLSSEWKKRLQPYVGHSYVIHNPVDPSIVHNKDISREQNQILLLGRNDAVKGHDFAISLGESLVGTIPDLKLVMTGIDRNTKPWIEAKGWVSEQEKLELLQKSSLLIVPSAYEGQPLTILEAVNKQFNSGEGAIQFAPEAIARSNADILNKDELRKEFIEIYSEQGKEEAKNWINLNFGPFSNEELNHRMTRYGLNPCGEILGNDFHCNLAEVHLNQIDPNDLEEQEKAFKSAALSVACLLNHKFEVQRYRVSREYDPIVGVSFTGLFDFFVHAFGTSWLKWWEEGRPDTDEGKLFKQKESRYLESWRKIVKETVWEYCDNHNLRRPNRCTTVQPAGTKSLLTGAAPGWHPPKAQRFIRRITFRKNDPVALACMDYGYSVVPSQSDKDENGCLLDNPFDPRCTEWLVEIPTEVSWANLEGADQININNFSALTQFDFYMQVQKFYTEHNTSATIEFRENEIEDLALAIHKAIDNNDGYISAALLARFDANATFPRLPFEPINKDEYDSLQNKVKERRVNNDFFDALNKYDIGELSEAGPAGCDSDKCLLPLDKPKN